MLRDLLEKLTRREDLTAEESAAAMGEIMEGRVSEPLVAALLMGLAMKGERPGEIVGFARAMRERAVGPVVRRRGVVDMCGTGGDRAGTFNISSVAALVVAACGVPVAKHGNRSVSSRCGSADLFEALGVRIAVPPEAVERLLDEAGIAFLYAPVFHPAMKHAAPVRRELGLRTAFNLLGPLTNPAGPARQVVGVPRPELTELMARALLGLGSERAWVVHGADGLDEISTTGYTKISECRDGAVNTFYVHPAEFGVTKARPSELKGGSAAENEVIARAVLSGAAGPARDVVLLNAAAALMIAGAAGTIQAGLSLGSEAIDTGAAAGVLERLVDVSQGLPA
ncbi:MAG: anthranilate phosphoribosyltransferase [Acidobacteria bacterium]|nr:MAG: anthranilate phosphoribosyltransferase [Acidobacteriota bacterium]RPJ76406.1 MAG: anthranilate phosphoribosyltransferase [Acidobacteriota bacterium]